jgi:hypothetical protein
MNDRGGCFGFEVLFLSFFFVFLRVISFSFTFVFHAFDSSRFPLVYLVLLSLRALFWLFLHLVEHLLCGPFIRSFVRFCGRSSSSGWFERIRQSTVV